MSETPRTSFNISREEMAALRELAADFGLYTTRGPNAGETGNITLLLRRLATSYRQDRAQARATLAPLLDQRAAATP